MERKTIKIETGFTPQQEYAYRHPARYKLFGGAMGGGKSFWLCRFILLACLHWPGSRWYLCRKEFASFRRTTLLTLGGILPRELVVDHNKSDMRYELPQGSQIWYGGLGTEADKDKIKSMELTGFAIDEASECEESSFLMLGSRLRLVVPGVRYQGILASNPEPGWVRMRFIDQQLPDHKFIPALPRDNPYLPGDYEERLRTLYRGNPSWAKAYLDGDWDAFAGTDYVLSYGDVLAASNRVLDPAGDVVIGVDVARFGDDETVLVCRLGPCVMEMQCHTKEDTMQTAGRVAAMCAKYPGATVNIDVGGVGAGVVDRLREQKIYVNEIHFGGKARDKEHFADWASEALAGALAERFREGRIQIPADDTLKAQLTARKYKMTSSGQCKIESKDDMKKRDLQSPDRADALMLAFAPASGWSIL